jgi:hypothetical protein
MQCAIRCASLNVIITIEMGGIQLSSSLEIVLNGLMVACVHKKT